MSTYLLSRLISAMVKSGELKGGKIEIARNISDEVAANRLTESEAVSKIKALCDRG